MSQLMKNDRYDPMERDLEERILSAIPFNELAFSKLLSLLDIRASDSIATACVSLGMRSTLLVNPKFIQKHCRTDEALSMLIMHELMHILLGHTRLFERVTPLQNIAFDAVINAQLCLQHPSPSYTLLFRGLYDDKALPFALLRPPEGWGTATEKWKLKNDELRLHQALYTDTSVTYLEIFRLLTSSGMDEGNFGDVTLLGNHDDKNHQTMTPEIMDEVSEIVARWPMVQRFDGRDQGGELSDRLIKPVSPRRQALARIRGALVQLADLESGYRGIAGPEDVSSSSLYPYPTGSDRRAGVLSLFGHEPVFYQGKALARSVGYHNRVHIYLDVSGSMYEELPLIYGALAPMEALIHPDIHLFSTRIEDIDIRALKQGRVSGTGGTDIAPVTAHMIENRVRRAVFITDGYVGTVPTDHELKLKRNGTRVNVILSHGGSDTFTNDLRGRVFWLPEL